MHFNLAENRSDADFPFAFMATYTSALAAHGTLRHLPLGQALREYAASKPQLLRLLEPLQQAMGKGGAGLNVFNVSTTIMFILERMRDRVPLGALADELTARFPERFASRQQALSSLGASVSQYSG